jgi:solute carrier family 13 (sodium-dependent dicarboxylate transporter), member 2/3/5
VTSLLSSLARLAQRWDAQRQNPSYRLGGVAFGLAAAALVLALPGAEGLTVAGQRTGAVAVLMAIWWLGGVLPMAVTALVPLVAFPLLDIMSIKAAAAPYAHHLNFLMLGGFVIGHATEEVGLHHRLTAHLLRPAAVRASPRRVVLAMMVSAAVISGLVSNTATMVMMLPLAASLAATTSDAPKAHSTFVLCLAYACSIGGVTTLVGTPPNAVLAGLASDAGREISFASWMALGVPFAICALPLAWWVVTRLAMPLPDHFETPLEALPIPAWRPGERSVLAVVAGALFLWLTRRPLVLGPLDLPGWSSWVPGQVSDAWVAILAALVLFMLPRTGPARPDDGAEGRFLLSWRRTEAAIPWSVLILLGGGFSLAAAISASGLTAWLAGGTAMLAELPLTLSVPLLCLAMSFLTELTSNTATTQIALPLLAAGAAAAGVDPLLWMVPAAVSASCAFMMPVATAPNAIASEAGGVAPGDMAYAGLALNVLCAGVAAVLTLVLTPLLF